MFKKIISFVLFFGILFNGTFSANAEKVNTKATWLWNPWMIVSDEQGTLDFLESKEVNKVYLQIDRDVPVEYYHSFIEKANTKGIKVFALDGSADWVAPNGSKYQLQILNWITAYQQNAPNIQQFAGIHFDIEPYIYSGWSTNQAQTIKTYQNLIVKAKQEANNLNLPFEVDMPFWFDEIMYKNTYGKGVLSEWVITHVDSVTIMAYRDSAQAIIKIVQSEINYAKKVNKSITIGVETMPSAEGKYVSFAEEGESYMLQQLKQVENHYAFNPAFKGIAIHHVDSWKNMIQ